MKQVYSKDRKKEMHHRHRNWVNGMEIMTQISELAVPPSPCFGIVVQLFQMFQGCFPICSIIF